MLSFRLFLVLALATLSLSQHYRIVPNHSLCQVNTKCFTLDQLAQTGLPTKGKNLTLNFQPGKHVLTRLFSIRRFTQVQIAGHNTSLITSNGVHWIELLDIDQVSIEGLTFMGSTQLTANGVRNLSIRNCNFLGTDTKSQDKTMRSNALIKLVKTTNARIESTLFKGNTGTALNISEAGTVSIENSTFTDNQGSLGGAISIDSIHARVSINGSFFDNNYAILGGAIYIYSGQVLVSNSELINNHANSGGGIFVESDNASVSVSHSNLSGNNGYIGGGLYVGSGNATISHSELTGNNASQYGGGIYLSSGSVNVSSSRLSDNIAFTHGGGIAVLTGNIYLSESELIGNSVEHYGGGIALNTGSVLVLHSVITSNTAGRSGGGIHVQSGKASLTISHTEITGNSAAWTGGGMSVDSGNASVSYCLLKGNMADDGGGITIGSGSASISHTVLMTNIALYNGGGIAVDSGSAFISHSNFTGNFAKDGGAIIAIEGEIYFNSVVTIVNNTATRSGGGVYVRESNFYVQSVAEISHNRAFDGGAIHAFNSRIDFANKGYQSTITNNVADNNGGGIIAIASVIKVKAFIVLDFNRAVENGGGLYLQQNSRLYIQKQDLERNTSEMMVNLTVSRNKARSGGGIYVDDSTASGDACRSRANGVSMDSIGDCFIQTIRLYNLACLYGMCNTVNTFITHNTAEQSGSAIFGGLLDRCTVSLTAELATIYTNFSSGLEYVNRTVQMPADDHSITSTPMQVAFCDDSPLDNLHVFARKGQLFRLHVKALDQAGQPVNATIHSSVDTKSGVGRLKEGQVEQTVGRECTELEYNVFSEDSSAAVELYAFGPCTNLGISNLNFTVTFLDCTCPLGFHPSQSIIGCSCECDDEMQVTECFPEEETFQLNIDKGLWIGVTNFTECNGTGYLIHDCPFDYCVDKPLNITLNSSQAIDRQCAYNRTGVLCGECDNGLSLVLCSSKCTECSSVFLLLLIPFAVAGVALVVFILWLNITIATGTTYGLILYANVLAANKAIFLPFETRNFLTVFVSWVNLDLGIETCFYDGMNSQAKVLLQLVFPAYLFLLIFLIIVLSKYVNSFAKLLSNRNPVAALCTLLILSYSKLLRVIIAALQFTYLVCPDHSFKIVWLYDANVLYFSPSHIPRFFAAAVILTACVLFTTLLFFGQWFPRCSKWKVMKWTKNTKYIGFMDAFHAPFTPKHRYWVGLLLFALIAHNLAASMAPDTSVPVLSAGCVALGLIVYKSLTSGVYMNRLNNTLETLFLLNLGILAYGTFAVTSKTGQLTLANVSMAVAFILFGVINCYHFGKYVLKKTNVWNNRVQPLILDFNISKNRDYQQETHTKIDESEVIEIRPVIDIYSGRQEAREETDPDKYVTPPIIRLATKADQLREPDLDILAPLTEEDYRQVLKA